MRTNHFFSKLLLLATVVFFACSKEEATDPDPLRYLALGDSYTIGQGVSAADRFPAQLTRALELENIPVAETDIIAMTGWTTQDLRNALEQQMPDSTYDLVSLLIGVNNQYQNQEAALYEPEFADLLDRAIALAGGRKERVFVLSIPDYAYTPFGQNFSDPPAISTEIDLFNQINENIAADRGVLYFNITPISRQGLVNPEWVAEDDLHPSGLMYQEWVSLCLPELSDLLRP